jgi:hypothetical protein
MAIRVVDVTDEPSFRLVPPCADRGFDHRSCDYWEDADRGSRAARLDWLEPAASPGSGPPSGPPPANPFAREAVAEPSFNPFAVSASGAGLGDNPFAPRRERQPVAFAGPRKLGLLARGAAIFGSYAKVLLDDDEPQAYTQFGPLSAYPRALRLRELYPQLPIAPPPAVITCIATTADARGRGLARRLVEEVLWLRRSGRR